MISASHLHAMIIHFPIALLIAGFVSEITGLILKKEFFRQAAFYMLLLGVIGSVAAYFSGDFAGEGIEEGPLKVPMELHEEAAAFTLWISVLTAIFRILVYFFKKEFQWIRWTGILLFGLLIASVARTGYLGGQLVYKHGAGVELGLPDFTNTAADED
jgi:uncharacterized membrane protein